MKHWRVCHAGTSVNERRVWNPQRCFRLYSGSFLVSFAQVLISAAEAAEMVLRVDDIIKCAPRQRQQQ